VPSLSRSHGHGNSSSVDINSFLLRTKPLQVEGALGKELPHRAAVEVLLVLLLLLGRVPIRKKLSSWTRVGS